MLSDSEAKNPSTVFFYVFCNLFSKYFRSTCQVYSWQGGSQSQKDRQSPSSPTLHQPQGQAVKWGSKHSEGEVSRREGSVTNTVQRDPLFFQNLTFSFMHLIFLWQCQPLFCVGLRCTDLMYKLFLALQHSPPVPREVPLALEPDHAAFSWNENRG